MLHIAGIDYESIADGEGVRTTIFVSGCLHDCPQCQSPKTHDFTYGTPVTKELTNTINQEISKRPFLSGISLSGGDPMYSPDGVRELVEQLVIPRQNIWCYTGFTFEELLENEQQKKLLSMIDVLVDGPFDYTKRDITLQFKGSSNQRIIDVQESIKQNKIILWRTTYEH